MGTESKKERLHEATMSDCIDQVRENTKESQTVSATGEHMEQRLHHLRRVTQRQNRRK